MIATLNECASIIRVAVKTAMDGWLIINPNEDSQDSEAADTARKLCLLTILWGESIQAEVGPDSPVRLVGVIHLRLVVDAGTGTKVAHDGAQSAFAALNRKFINGVVTKSPSLGEETVEDSKFSVSVSVPFYADMAAP